MEALKIENLKKTFDVGEKTNAFSNFFSGKNDKIDMHEHLDKALEQLRIELYEYPQPHVPLEFLQKAITTIDKVGVASTL